MALVPFNLYYSEKRGDNFTTATKEGRQAAEASDYQCVRDEGLIYDKEVSGGVPLRLYYSEKRGDNFTTATKEGRQAAEASDYKFVRVEGYVYPNQESDKGFVPLKLYYNAERGDNFTTATKEGRQAAEASGYNFVRIEGYIAPNHYGKAQLLDLEGTAVFNSAYVDASGTKLSFHLVLKNKTPGPVKITRANFFYLSQRGWVESRFELISKDGNFLGVGPTIGPNANHVINSSAGWYDEGPGQISFLAFQLYCNDGTNSQSLVKNLRVGNHILDGPPNGFESRVFLGIQEPVEVVDMDNQKKWLTIIAQLVNGTGNGQSVKELTLRLSAPFRQPVNKTLPIKLFVSTADGWKQAQHWWSTEPTLTFLFSEDLWTWWTQGAFAHLWIKTSVEGHCISNYCSAAISRVNRANTPTLRPPIKGQWMAGNGPGQPTLNGHSFPGNRYSYDIGMYVNGTTLKDPNGSENENTNFIIFGKPISCMKDGKVVEVIDNIQDNNGRDPAVIPPGQPTGNSRIVIESKDGLYTYYHVYAHIKQNSSSSLGLLPGDPVKAGEQLASVGNVGASSEPHLHLGFYRKDGDRIVSRPMFFEGLRSLSGELIFGTPQGGVEYVS